MAITCHEICHFGSEASFEESTEVLFEASIFAGKGWTKKEVTENIMLGQLAPIGTGSFDLYLNEKMLANPVDIGTNYESKNK
jgi:DNA-directed RNA polymerase II subunit RPB1